MKVLVGYASRHGSTEEIAERIGARLREAGVETEVVAVDAVGELDEFGAVVLGSAVYVGKWLEPAREFVALHEDELRARRVWLFSSGPLGDPPKPEPEHAIDLDGISEKTLALDHRLFAGKLDRSRLGVGERAVARLVKAADGDFRDFDEIDVWAEEIAKVCNAAPERVGAR